MKVFQNKNKIVFVASPPVDSRCPRLLLDGNMVVLRDDYHNKVKIKSSLVKKLF